LSETTFWTWDADQPSPREGSVEGSADQRRGEVVIESEAELRRPQADEQNLDESVEKLER